MILLAWHTEGKQRFDYRFDRAWDSEHNRVAVQNFAPVGYFTCPFESSLESYPYVTYVMLVRPEMDMGSLPPDAVLIVESANCGIKFAEPRDLQWDALWEGPSPFGPGKLNSLHPKVVKGVRVDGKVIDIPKDIGRDELRRLLEGTSSTP